MAVNARLLAQLLSRETSSLLAQAGAGAPPATIEPTFQRLHAAGPTAVDLLLALPRAVAAAAAWHTPVTTGRTNWAIRLIVNAQPIEWQEALAAYTREHRGDFVRGLQSLGDDARFTTVTVDRPTRLSLPTVADYRNDEVRASLGVLLLGNPHTLRRPPLRSGDAPDLATATPAGVTYRVRPSAVRFGGERPMLQHRHGTGQLGRRPAQPGPHS